VIRMSRVKINMSVREHYSRPGPISKRFSEKKNNQKTNTARDGVPARREQSTNPGRRKLPTTKRGQKRARGHPPGNPQRRGKKRDKTPRNIPSPGAAPRIADTGERKPLDSGEMLHKSATGGAPRKSPLGGGPPTGSSVHAKRARHHQKWVV